MGSFARLLRIERGETRLASSVVAVMLLTAVGAGAGATAADALLFARFGVESLPQLYLALGVVSFACALVVSIVFGAIRRERVYPVTLAALAAALVGLRGLAAGPGDIGYPAMWLGANVVTMLQGIVGWGVASWLCDARQAKRLFPIANAAKIGGAILGAAAVAPLVLVFRLEDLLIVWALTLAATFALVVRLARTAPAAPIERRAVSLRDELLSGFRVVSASPLLRWLAISLVLFSVLYFSLALPFTRAARAAMPQEDDLASFLGLFNASTTAVAFLASLLVANRIYARFGVVNAILGFTLIYLAGFATLVLTDSFLAIAAVRWLQLAWLAGIADAAYQALFNPVPQERRDQMRAFMEGVPGQVGIALAGVLLIVGDRAFEPRQVAIAGVVVAAATTAVIWRIRGAYRDALVAALRIGRPEPFLGAEEAYRELLQDRVALDVLREGLRSPDAATRTAAAQILEDAERGRPQAPSVAQAEEVLGTGEVDTALTMFEASHDARVSPALASFAEAERGRASRYRAFATAVPSGDGIADVLRVSLLNRAGVAVRRAVRASAVASGRVAPPSLLDSLASADTRVRAEGLETLESYVRPDLARPLIAIWESAPPEVRLADLAHDEDPWLRECLEHLGGGTAMPLTTVALMDRVLFLRKVPLFAALDPADLQQVGRIATERAFADGEVIARQGDMGDALYVVVAGAVRVEQDGRAIASRGRGEAVGEMSIVSATPRIATLVAAGDTKTLRIGRAEFESILRDRPETALGVIKTLAARLTEATAPR
ncbi:MAG TPA: cyclic nucleotide-binding domain-containing protein [Candidatus Acidoferrales bacterium]|nr:cyclic nucleotide-binding domain-containing protein [Candidatus Acidoferrales bacterium]